MKKEELVVVKHNNIVNASYRLSLLEQRILLACIAQLDSKSDEVMPDVFEVSVSQISDLVGKTTTSGGAYKNIRDGVERLWRREISFSETGDKKEHFAKMRWVQRVDYYENAGKLSLTFSKDILQYLTQLKGNFTQYKLEYVAYFRNVYSVRVYELLVQWMSSGEREISVDEFRKKLVLEDKYPVFAELKRNVLDKAVKDINKYSNIRCSYGQRKLGRKVVAFQFRFRLKDSKPVSKKQKGIQSATGNIGKLAQGSTTDARVGETMAEYLARMKREKK
jgi:plasmid replication initiation protein